MEMGKFQPFPLFIVISLVLGVVLSSNCVQAFTLPHETLLNGGSCRTLTSTSASRNHFRHHLHSSPSSSSLLFNIPRQTSQKSDHVHVHVGSSTTTKTTTTSLQATPSPLAIANPNVPPRLNAALVISSIGILVGYHLNLFRKEFKSENGSGTASKYKTWRQYQADTREDWARYVRETEGWLYAIQSLRNAITAQTFLATTVLSLLTLITGRIWDILRSASNPTEIRLLTVQLASIAMTMLVSAYQFLQGVRLMTHAGFMFPVKKNDTKVDNIMRQTQNCQWLGLRWMYISLGPIAWAVGGSRAFFIAAVTLLQFFRSIDKKPEGLGYEEFQGAAI